MNQDKKQGHQYLDINQHRVCERGEYESIRIDYFQRVTDGIVRL